MEIIMKRIINYFSLVLILLLGLSLNVKAKTNSIYVDLGNLEYSVNKKDYQAITEYKTLEEFLKDYNSNNLSDIYITDFLFDGVSSVKSPDLDDFIESTPEWANWLGGD